MLLHKDKANDHDGLYIFRRNVKGKKRAVFLSFCALTFHLLECLAIIFNNEKYLKTRAWEE